MGRSNTTLDPMAFRHICQCRCTAQRERGKEGRTTFASALFPTRSGPGAWSDLVRPNADMLFFLLIGGAYLELEA